MITNLRRLLAGFVVVAGTLLLGATAAAAGVLQEAPGDAPVGDTLTLSAASVNIIIGVLLPILLGVLLKESNPQWVKTIGGIVVAGIAAIVTEAIRDDGTAVLSWDMFLTFVTVYVPQIVSYLGFWQPLGRDTSAGTFNLALGPGVVPFEGHTTTTTPTR
jgi:hypothetical protein